VKIENKRVPALTAAAMRIVVDVNRNSTRMPGDPEVISSPIGLVPTNALVFTDLLSLA
jgi:N-formylglutamate amidohydrolase